MRRSTPSLLRFVAWLFLGSTVTAAAEVRINEIHYRPKNESVTEEFIELWNYGEKRVSLASWQLDRGVQFSFNNQSIPPGAGLVIAADPDWLGGKHPALSNIAGPWIGRLGNNGETIRLLDERGKPVSYTHLTLPTICSV